MQGFAKTCRVRWPFLGGLLCLGALAVPGSAWAEGCGGALERMAQSHHFPISCEEEAHTTLDTVATGRPTPALLAHFAPYLQAFVDSYPEGFVARHLSTLYLNEQLFWRGQPVAGLSDGRRVWIKVRQYHAPYADFLSTALHHEFSSNVLKASYAHVVAWRRAAPDRYDSSSQNIDKNIGDFEHSRSGSDAIYREGFVFNYGKTSPENDFNTYAELLFVRPQELQRLTQGYPIIADKLRVLKSIYRQQGFVGRFPDER